MNMFSALMITVTMTMTVFMLPRIYMTWIIAEHCCMEGETEQLVYLLADENGWALRQFGCGAVAIALIWMVHNSPHDLGVPASMEAALAVYGVISLVFAVLESLIAQKISDFLALAPATAKVRPPR